jgi:hypothetical protein
MPSRQMAFQISEFEYRETLKTLIAARDQVQSITDWVDQIPEEKKRLKTQLILKVAVDFHRKERDPLLVTKIICWRDEKGRPGPVDIQLRRLEA